MGFIGSLFGGDSGNSGGAGMNYQAAGPQQYQINDAWSNTQSALSQQQAFINALNGQNSGVFTGQAQLANQLQGLASGQGPNPAQQQFQNNANQIAAQTAGLIGSQKGINPALQARLIAQQGAGAQQQVAGQGAALQAQQQLAAMGALQDQYSNMIGQQQNAMNAFQSGALAQQGNVLGLQGNANSANAGVSQVTAGQQGKVAGGIFSGLGGLLGMSQGGEVPCYSDGGAVGGPQSRFGKMMAGGGVVPGSAKVPGDSPKNDTVKAKLSPGEIVIPRSIAQHPNAPDLTAKFVAAIKARNGRGL